MAIATPGPKGDTGATGPSGPPGPTVTVTATPAPMPSVKASTGPSGSAGVAGEPGTPGTAGPSGTPGAPGVDGSDGTAGADGIDGTCTPLDTASLAGDLIPAADNIYSLGTGLMRWKSLQLGPGTLYIQDTETGKQAGITISDGTLLLDGVDGLRIGNVRFTSTGITSLLAGQDITIGSVGDLGWMSVAHGIKFADGTTQTTATVAGPAGPRGLTGTSGPTGPPGPPGSIEANGYVETKACMYTGRPNNIATGTLMIGSCIELGQEGKDIQILIKQ